MVNEVRDNLGGETSETISDTRILRFLNRAYLEICSRYLFPQLVTSDTLTTVADTASSEMNAEDVLKIVKVVDDTNNVLVYPLSVSQYHDYVSGNASSITGVPQFWVLNGVGSNDRYQITWYPTPNAAISEIVYYVKEPAELVTEPTASSPVIPEPFDDVIIHKATARGWRMLGDMDMSRQWAGATREVEQAAARVAYEESRFPIQLGSMVGSALR
jgi:hypothetical protein